MLALPWFMCFFVGYIPWRAGLRIFDLVLTLGANILFQIGLAVFYVCEEKILEIENEPDKVVPIIADSIIDENFLIEVACTRYGDLPYNKMEALRKEKTANIMKGMQFSADEKFLQKIIEKHPNLNRYSFSTIREIHKDFIDISSNNSKNEDMNKGINQEQFIELIFQYIPHIKILCDGKPGTVIMFFRHLCNGELLSEEDFMKLLSILAKGSLPEQFLLCIEIICPYTDVSKSDFRGVLDVLFRIAYTGSGNYNVCSKRLDTFTEIVYEKLRGHKDDLSIEKLKELILDTHLLEDLWTQLIFLEKS